MRAGIEGTLTKAEKHPRAMTSGNLLINVISGAVIGLGAAWLVHWFNSLLGPPWSYLVTAGILLLAKVAWRWVTTLWLSPLVGEWAARLFEKQTGVPIPQHMRNFQWGSDSLSIVTFAATIAVAGYLANLKMESGDPAEGVSGTGIIWITMTVGAITAASQCLSSRITIISLWHNKFEYQDNPAYRQSRGNIQSPPRASGQGSTRNRRSGR